MQEVIKIVSENNLETVIIALLVNVITAVVKIPLKRNSGKVKKYTGYIVFIPIAISLILALTYQYLTTKTLSFNQSVITTWLTSASVSLAIYAVIEKVIPKNYVYLTEEEQALNLAVIEKLKTATVSYAVSENNDLTVINGEQKTNDTANIVLKGGK